ncbi:30S ribosomal protein S14 [Candidatus Micrarchaeota archaeon CG10_big_fil_rev_8_21_14_0_10_45_29]|nr:MAG: 30S ribosomal protein S14 [Candidatus Micrarchaeota archaeon CG10_big_fil_rev_8_21_14_0_10_45_29]
MAKREKNPLPFEYKKRGKGKRKCRITGNAKGIIRSYGLQLSRRVFREIAENIGFRKY